MLQHSIDSGDVLYQQLILVRWWDIGAITDSSTQHVANDELEYLHHNLALHQHFFPLFRAGSLPICMHIFFIVSLIGS